MRTLTVLLVTALLPAAALAQTAAVPPDNLTGKFALQLQGKQIGSADYAFQSTETGWAGTAHYDFNLQAEVATTRRLTFTKNWAILTESQAVNVAATTQSLTLTPNATSTKLAFHAEASGQTFDAAFDLTPHTVVLPNFDPAGLQVLLNLQAANPAPDATYTCFIPSGQGTALPCTFTTAGKGHGTLDGKPIELAHWLLKLGPLTMDVWSATNNALQQASVAAQDVAYIRAGFSLTKDTAAASAPPPTPVPDDAIERELTFPSDGLTVPATLTLPHDAKSRVSKGVPIVVLVQGSGVQDRDETVGANKVFQQLAWGLAQRGIATLRYDRRPKFDAANFAQHFDLDHEVVIDAANALAFCASVPEADPSQVFLLGHSLGAQLAPYIVQRRLQEKPNSVRGYILLAGVETPIDQTILRQVAEFSKADGSPDSPEKDEQVKASVAKWQAIFAQVNDPRTPGDKVVGPGNVPAAYWRDWIKRDPAAIMKQLPIPALVLRGELDRNVVHEDFTALSAAATVPGSKSEEFPGLNHLFMPVKDEHADELQPGKISPEVLNTISGWIEAIAHSNR
jgi:pimeloyl-ACP methyl ester carboxylesterase